MVWSLVHWTTLQTPIDQGIRVCQKDCSAYIEGRKTPEEREAALALARSTAEDNEKYAAEVRAGRVPATPLSRLVWENWKRFPDCILLTQVGNFYEVSTYEVVTDISRTLSRQSRCPACLAPS